MPKYNTPNNPHNLKNLSHYKKHKQRTEIFCELGAKPQLYVYTPSILDVEVGNCITFFVEPVWCDISKKNWNSLWGIVESVDYINNQILIIQKEKRMWFSIEDVDCTWNIGGYAKAKETLASFKKHVEDVLT